VSLAICIFFLIPFTGLYVSLGGLWGVLWTDLFQFVLKMGIVVAVAYYGVRGAGGMHAMLAKLAAMRSVAGPGASQITAMFPDFSRGLTGEALWTLPVLTFLVHLGVQWWAFWYPGSEPGGGGYIAQRIFSARDERHGLLSVLWFNVAHYALRPWPWILTALAAAALYPGLQHPESGYMLVAIHYMPPALRGILIAGFMAAFMSTIATQLNWGSSYLVEDFYRRFIRRDATEKHYVNISRVATLLLVAASAYVSAQLVTISQGWEVVLEVGAGTGGVYLLRWYWWRINAWSEIAAMAASLVSVVALHWLNLFVGQPAPVIFAKTAIATTAITTVAWVAVTLMTQPESDAVLLSFYRKVRPDVRGWKPVAARAPEVTPTRDVGQNLLDWVLGCGMVYSALFGVGKILLHQPGIGSALVVLAIVCAWLLYRDIQRGWGVEDRAAAAK
jgi:solute:Na+ symporter, SSS family